MGRKKNAIVNSDAKAENEDLQNAFPDKLMKKLPSGWADTATAMSEEELKKTIVDCEGNIYTIDKEKKSDVLLTAAKETVKESSIPYREAAAAQSAKIQYCLFLLENRGTNLDSTDSEE